MRRSSQWMVVFVVLVVSAGSVQAQSIPACQLGWELRQALGFGPAVLAALGVGGSASATIATAAQTFCDQNRETIEPLLAAVREARATVMRTYELGGDVATADAELLEVVSDLASASAAVITSMSGSLTTEQQTLQARVASHRLLDETLALLDLSGQQVSDLRAAQRTRDLVLRHHGERSSPARCSAACAAFASAVASILDDEQEADRSELDSALRQNSAAREAAEELFCSDVLIGG